MLFGVYAGIISYESIRRTSENIRTVPSLSNFESSNRFPFAIPTWLCSWTCRRNPWAATLFQILRPWLRQGFSGILSPEKKNENFALNSPTLSLHAPTSKRSQEPITAPLGGLQKLPFGFYICYIRHLETIHSWNLTCCYTVMETRLHRKPRASVQGTRHCPIAKNESWQETNKYKYTIPDSWYQANRRLITALVKCGSWTINPSWSLIALHCFAAFPWKRSI